MRSKVTIIAAFLCIVTAVLYLPVRNYEFLSFDDNEYVTENSYVLAGLEARTVVWAFTKFHSSNWHPLTWLSHMLDIELWGENAGGHHITNVVFHCANSVLLFLVLSSMTGALWRSAFVALVFAWHPLHVESVAWIAERKDVLSTFFWILTMAAYLHYVRQPGLWRYVAVVALFACGLMSKPMVVTLPFVLLLLDYWPLQRAMLDRAHFQKWLNLFLEKIPLFVLVLLSIAITMQTQHRGGAVKSIADVPLDLRVSNAVISYVSYLWKSIWPVELAVFYPLPSAIPLWQPAAAFILLLIITALAVRAAKQHPYLPVGWFWYVGTLVPVIGVVQVGYQSMADRYTYVPLIGIAIAITWGSWELLKKTSQARAIAPVLGIIVSLLLLQASSRQLQYWRNSFTLFERALSVTSGNWMIHNNLSSALLTRPDELAAALHHASEAVRLRPSFPPAQLNFGVALLRQGKSSEAILHLEKALELQPNWADAHPNLGAALMVAGRVEEAIAHFYAALRLEPDNVQALKSIAWLRATQPVAERRDSKEAMDFAERAAELSSQRERAEVLDVLAAALAEAGDFDKAIETAERARTLAIENDQAALADEIGKRLELYQLGLPYRSFR